jgi:predicted metal-dependent peptidase
MSVHQKALDKAKIQLMMTPDSAFFTTVCFSMKHIWDESIPTACTNGTEIRYLPEFFMAQSPAEQLFLILHETLHVALQHVTRRGDRDPQKWNIAADYVINYILVKAGFKMPQGGLYDKKYAGMNTDNVYDLLPDEESGGLPMLPMDDIREAGDDATQQETAEKIDDILVQASLHSKMAGDKAGSIPGEIDFYIQKLIAPKLPWDRILKSFFSKTIKQGYTLRRPNRRFWPDHYLPSRNSKALCHIAVAIDTSGSVSDDEFARFASEVYSIMKRQKPTQLTLIQFDTTIKTISEIRSAKDLLSTEFHGRGGTHIEPVMDWAAKNKPTVLLVFSDGHFRNEFPNPKVPIVWLINDNPGYQARYGKVIKYEA